MLAQVCPKLREIITFKDIKLRQVAEKLEGKPGKLLERTKQWNNFVGDDAATTLKGRVTPRSVNRSTSLRSCMSLSGSKSSPKM